MHCISCFRNIKDALQELDAEIKLEAQIQERVLNVESTKSVEEIKLVLTQAGYPVTAHFK